MDVSIVLPGYNEADNVPKLRDELFPVVRQLARRYSIEVIFVDDGSTDGTGDALEAAFCTSHFAESAGFPVRVVRHARNRGLGAALRTGFSESTGDFVVTTDMDGTYRFDVIPALIESLKPGLDMVTGSPYHPAGRVVGVPEHRLLFSKGASLLYRHLAGREVYCYTALFRIYRRSVIKNIQFDANGFLAGTELMVKAMLSGYRAGELPAVLHSRMHGVSKAKIARTVRAHLSFLWRVLLHRSRLKPLVASGDGRAPQVGEA